MTKFFNKSHSVLRTYFCSVHSALVTDASPVGIVVHFGQESRPVICVSLKLTIDEVGYSQPQWEALTVLWGVKELH